MTCPQCGLDMTPGKVCVNCGYDSGRPGASPSDKPGIPITPKEDDTYSTRDVGVVLFGRDGNAGLVGGASARPARVIPAVHAHFPGCHVEPTLWTRHRPPPFLT